VQIKLLGKASGKTRILEVSEIDLNKDLLTLLRSLEIPVASSCSGEGICKKCIIQNDWLSCKMTLKEFLTREPDGIIRISYL